MFSDIRQFVTLLKGAQSTMLVRVITGQPSEDVGHTTDPNFFDARVPPSAYDKYAAYTPSS